MLSERDIHERADGGKTYQQGPGRYSIQVIYGKCIKIP